MALEFTCLNCSSDVPPGTSTCVSCVIQPPNVQVKDGSTLTGVNGQYMVDSLLSNKGGTALTYKGHDGTGKAVVIKQLLEVDDPDPIKAQQLNQDYQIRFEREAKLLMRYRNPDLPEGHDFFTELGQQFLVEEFVEGTDLKDLVQNQGAMDYDSALLAGIAACDTLDFVHGQNVLHRDIKPDNIIQRKRNKRLVLIDFGSALDQPHTGGKTTLIPGTPGYISWHQETGKTDETDDYFALGYTIIYLVTGIEPREHAENRDHLLSILPPSWQQTFDFITQDELIYRGGSTGPGDVGLRYKTAKDLKAQLISLLSPAAQAAYGAHAAIPPTAQLAQPAAAPPPPSPAPVLAGPITVQFTPSTASMFNRYFYQQSIGGVVLQGGVPRPGLQVIPRKTDSGGPTTALGVRGTTVTTQAPLGDFGLKANDITVPVAVNQRVIELSFVDSAGNVLHTETVTIDNPQTANQPAGAAQATPGPKASWLNKPAKWWYNWQMARAVNAQNNAQSNAQLQQARAQAQAAKLAAQAQIAQAQAQVQAAQMQAQAQQQAQAIAAGTYVHPFWSWLRYISGGIAILSLLLLLITFLLGASWWWWNFFGVIGGVVGIAVSFYPQMMRKWRQRSATQQAAQAQTVRTTIPGWVAMGLCGTGFLFGLLLISPWWPYCLWVMAWSFWGMVLSGGYIRQVRKNPNFNWRADWKKIFRPALSTLWIGIWTMALIGWLVTPSTPTAKAKDKKDKEVIEKAEQKKEDGWSWLWPKKPDIPATTNAGPPPCKDDAPTDPEWKFGPTALISDQFYQIPLAVTLKRCDQVVANKAITVRHDWDSQDATTDGSGTASFLFSFPAMHGKVRFILNVDGKTFENDWPKLAEPSAANGSMTVQRRNQDGTTTFVLTTRDAESVLTRAAIKITATSDVSVAFSKSSDKALSGRNFTVITDGQGSAIIRITVEANQSAASVSFELKGNPTVKSGPFRIQPPRAEGETTQLRTGAPGSSHVARVLATRILANRNHTDI